MQSVYRFSFLLLAGCILSGQSPTIRVTTRMVEVNTVVRDNKGPIRGLTQADFTILDNGKPRPIAFFSVNTVSAVHSPAKLPPGTFTNTTGIRDENGGPATVILIEAGNMFRQQQVRDQFVKFLSQIRPQDRVAVYQFGRKLTVLSDFTNDPKKLLASMAGYLGTPDGLQEAADPRSNDYISTSSLDVSAVAGASESPIQRAFSAIQEWAQLERADHTVIALEAISDHLAQFPGRKNLIWITNNIPLEIDMALKLNHADSTQRTVIAQKTMRALKALNDANVAVYPVSIGLEGAPRSMTAANGPVSRQQAESGLNVSSMYVAKDHDSLIAIANVTGGVASYNSNDGVAMVRRAMDDSEVSYTLGFYPETSDLDSSFHDVKVKVNRKGADVRSRKGYRAMPEVALADQERKVLLRDALFSPLQSTQIGLSATFTRDANQPRILHLSMAVEPKDIVLDASDGKWHASFDFIAGQETAKGDIYDPNPKSFALNLDGAQYKAMTQQGMNFNHELQLYPNVTHIRLVLLDHRSGHMGSLIIPVRRR